MENVCVREITAAIKDACGIAQRRSEDEARAMVHAILLQVEDKLGVGTLVPETGSAARRHEDRKNLFFKTVREGPNLLRNPAMFKKRVEEFERLLGG